MIFKNYHYEKPDTQLEVGDYLAKIIKTEDKVANNGNTYVMVTVAIKDHPGCNPSVMMYYDIPTAGEQKQNGNVVTEDDVKKACQSLSRFLDAFSIPAMQASNIASWVNHVGTVHCDWQYDASEPDKKSKKYKGLWPKLKARENTGVETAEAAPQGFVKKDIIF